MDAIILRGSRVNLAVLSRLAIGDWGNMVNIRMAVLDWMTVKPCTRPPAVSITGQWIRGLTVFGDVKT